MDKPAGATSHDVVAIVRRQLSCRAVGHTGTLDPFATGLLVLVIGGATRLARFVEAGTKRYRATALFGTATTTDDVTGEPIGTPYQGAWPEEASVERAMASLIGTIAQRPPVFSAKLVDGVRSYRLARAGNAVTLDEAMVRVEALAIASYRPPALEFVADVGPGTYLRSIARDLGERLGVAAHLTSLRREQVGRFRVDDAVALEKVSQTTGLVSPLDLVGDMPRVELTAAEVAAVRQGRVVGAVPPMAEQTSALVHGGELVAIGTPREGRWQPVTVLGPE